MAFPKVAPKKKLSSSPPAKNKFGKVMKEFSAGALHSGSPKGPQVQKPAQAKAIAASEVLKEYGA